jgi:glycosyltransferase involved in cell wall biosynthesis
MKIAIITNSSSYEPRVQMASDFFVRRGYQVCLILSDFIHREKRKGHPAIENAVLIDTIPYNRNLSLKRLYSHYDFSKKVYAYLSHEDFDIIYVMVPANSLAKYMALHKREYHKGLIIDILDLWPESLPFNFAKKIWPFSAWMKLRNDNLKYADLIITECNLYQTVLRNHLIHTPVRNVYWPRETEAIVELCERENDRRIHLCYLGSINHIIDIDFMVKLLACIQKYKAVTLHIIGDGENREKLIKVLDLARIDTVFYGPIYEETEKMKVLSSCDYGLNIMKPSVCVGVTMKSVDYLYAGLGLINTIKGDTWQFIEEDGIGYNCNSENMDEVAQKIAENVIGKEAKETVRQCYLRNFSKDAYVNSMEKCLEIVEKIRGKSE